MLSRLSLFTLAVRSLVLLMLVLSCSQEGHSQTDKKYVLSGPFTHENLTVFLIHGKDSRKTDKLLTLKEAIDKKIVVVEETGNVNKLQIKNKSKKYDVFIQAGEIVKGGRQDRVLADDIIIPANKTVPISSFCVEHGRWSGRGGESAAAFGSSNYNFSGKALKIAVRKDKNQHEVWNNVSSEQEKLSKSVGASVKSNVSASSFQLSLEDRNLKKKADEYKKELSDIDGGDDVIGYVTVINGEINSADIYCSHVLFKKLWDKNLNSATTEAIAELNNWKEKSKIKKPDVNKFLNKLNDTNGKEKNVDGRVSVNVKEDGGQIIFESRDNKKFVRKNYIKK